MSVVRGAIEDSVRALGVVLPKRGVIRRTVRDTPILGLKPTRESSLVHKSAKFFLGTVRERQIERARVDVVDAARTLIALHEHLEQSHGRRRRVQIFHQCVHVVIVLKQTVLSVPLLRQTRAKNLVSLDVESPGPDGVKLKRRNDERSTRAGRQHATHVGEKSRFWNSGEHFKINVVH